VVAAAVHMPFAASADDWKPMGMFG
jgi:hypothetical protein